MANLSENPPSPNVSGGSSDIVIFIERARDRGASDEFISQLLQRFGWPQREIERAFFQVYERLTGYPIPSPPSGGGELAKDGGFCTTPQKGIVHSETGKTQFSLPAFC